MTLTLNYSTYTSVHDTAPAPGAATWAEFVARLTNPFVTADKAVVGLWNASTYKFAARRKLDDLVSVHALILDFDNAREIKDAAGNKTKVRVDNPIQIADVEARVAGHEFVVHTSYSHTADWPRFRLVMPLVAPVPQEQWEAYAETALRDLNLRFTPDQGLDKCYQNPNQIYYWPTVKPGAQFYQRHNPGTYLNVVNPDVNLVYQTRGPRHGGLDDRFTIEQVEKYYADRLPDYERHDVGGEWRGFCPFHGGEGNMNFSINATDGRWKCYSQCQDTNHPGLGGGDIYQFEMRLKGVDFPTAKKAIDALLGVDDDRSTYMSFSAIQTNIQSAGTDSLPMIKEAIAAHGSIKERNQLVKQLVTMHQLDPIQTTEEIKQLRETIKKTRETKIVAFPKQNNELAAHVANQAAQQATQTVELTKSTTDPNKFGLKLPENKYIIDDNGVYPVKGVTIADQFHWEPQYSRPTATRPIWPGAMGSDLATGRVWVRLHWYGSRRMLHTEWLPGEATNSRDTLLGLDDSPISIGKVTEVSDYLNVAKASVIADFIPVTSQIGWVGEQNNLMFVLDTDPNIQYIGRPIKRRGNAVGWASPLKEVLRAGATGYTALAVIALSAASPLVRLTGKRNPIIGLVSDSSQGKGTLLNWALSIWDEPTGLTIPAGSTVKGTQDMSINNADMPIWVDELQQLKKQDPRRVEDVLYYLANGQRRVTSSRNQIAKGGERRHGPGFYASEAPVLDGAQKGVHFRTIELNGAPVWNARVAHDINAAARNHYGQIGVLIADLVNVYRDDFTQAIESQAAALAYAYPDLQGDDPYTIAYVHQGLVLLGMALGVTLPANAVRDWLVSMLRSQRRTTKDMYAAVWEYMIDSVMSSLWSPAMPNVLDEPGAFIAFRLDQAIDPNVSPLEINPTAPRMSHMLRGFGADESFARVWADRGWIVKQSSNLKWTRRSKEGIGARVWRISLDGLAVVGLSHKLEEI